MNQPQLTNVTPGASGTLGSSGRPPGAAAPRASLPTLAIAALIALAVLYVGWKLLHHANRNEHLAANVTRAIAKNDMSPVEKDFNALRRPELENRGTVGRLSDFVNAEGAYKGIKEDTPSGSAAGFHHFTVHFEKGDLQEVMTLDGDGKIADFHVRPLTSQ